MKAKARTNDGIFLSLSNGIYGAKVTLIVLSLTLSFVLGSQFSHLPGNSVPKMIVAAVAQAISIAVIAFLWFGGMDMARHYALRLMVMLCGHAPFRLDQFCEHACRLVLMQRIGFGFDFKNHVLREYFENRPLKRRRH